MAGHEEDLIVPQESLQEITPFQLALGDSISFAKQVERDDRAIGECSSSTTHRAMDDEWYIALERLVDVEECKHYIECAERCGMKSVAGEYDESYRQARRAVVQCSALADVLWRKLARVLNVRDVRCKAPAALGGDLWRAVGVNECFRISRYEPGGKFELHRDGPYLQRGTSASMYTLLVYLNDVEPDQGGSTRFYTARDWDSGQAGEAQYINKFKETEQSAGRCVSVTPRAGRALIFPHSVLHEGEVLTGGSKFVLRTDIMFSREEPLKQNMSGSAVVAELMKEADEHEANGDVKRATASYVRALEELYGREDGGGDHSGVEPECDTSFPEQCNDCLLLSLPNEVVIRIAQNLSYMDVGSLMATCHELNAVLKDNEMWQGFYVSHWSDLPFGLGSVSDFDVDEVIPMIDWHDAVLRRHCRERFALTTAAVSCGEVRITTCVTQGTMRSSAFYTVIQGCHNTIVDTLTTEFDYTSPELKQVWMPVRRIQTSEYFGFFWRYAARVAAPEAVIIVAPPVARFGSITPYCLRDLRMNTCIVNEASAVTYYLHHRDMHDAVLEKEGRHELQARPLFLKQSAIVIGIGQAHAYVARVQGGAVSRVIPLGAAGNEVNDEMHRLGLTLKQWKGWGKDDHHGYNGSEDVRGMVLCHYEKINNCFVECQGVKESKSTKHAWRNQCFEVLFKPGHGVGVVEAVEELLRDELYPDEEDLLQHIITIGGSTAARGFSERVAADLKAARQSRNPVITHVAGMQVEEMLKVLRQQPFHANFQELEESDSLSLVAGFLDPIGVGGE